MKKSENCFPCSSMIFPALSAGWRSKSEFQPVPGVSGGVSHLLPIHRGIRPPVPSELWGKGDHPPTGEQLDLTRWAGVGVCFLFSDGSISCFTPPIQPLIYTPILKAEGFLWSVWKSRCATTAAPGELSVLFRRLLMAVFFYHSKFDVQPDALAKLRCCCWDRFSPLFSWCY